MTPSVRVAAHPPLLRGGLERLVHDAGVAVSDGVRPDIVLRSNVPPSDSDLDVVFADGVFTITCSGRPAPEVWQALLRIIDVAY